MDTIRQGVTKFLSLSQTTQVAIMRDFGFEYDWHKNHLDQRAEFFKHVKEQGRVLEFLTRDRPRSEQEYVDSLAATLVKQSNDGKIPYLSSMDTGCNCAGKTFVPDDVRADTNDCSCALLMRAVKQSRLEY